MSNNDPGGLSPQQMRTLGIMGGLFLLCFIVISLVSDLDLPGPIPTLIRFAPTGIILIATYYAARHVSSTSDNGAQERSATPTAPSAGEHPERPPENSGHEAGEGSAQHPSSQEGTASWLRQARSRLTGTPTRTSDEATIAGAITRAQRSGSLVINLFTPDVALPDDIEALGARIVEAVLSHISALDETASITVSGSSTPSECSLSISALTAYAPVLEARPIDEIQALAASLGGGVDTDAQVGTWTLTARLPTAAGAPS